MLSTEFGMLSLVYINVNMTVMATDKTNYIPLLALSVYSETEMDLK